MERASRHDLAQFRNWYSQAGTPVVKAASVYDSETRTYELTLAQHCPPTPGQPDKKPFVIPVTASLYDVQGNRIKLEGGVEETTLVLDSPEQVFHFANIETEPVPSLLRRFSAPVELEIDLDDSQLSLLMHHDNDPFNRWESGQKLFLKQLLLDIKKFSENPPRPDNPELEIVIQSLLTSNHEDQAFLARLMTLPAISYISEQTSPIDPSAVEISLRNLKRSIAKFCRHELEACYRECHSKSTGAPSPEESAARSLRDTCLGYLMSLDDLSAWKLCRTQLDNSRCMTDSSSALTLISASSDPDREDILNQFYQEWQAEPLVVDKWLRAQAIVPEARTLEIVRNLTRHPGFDQTNPNKIYSLILGFTHGNPFCFHAEDGTGYEFAREWVEILDPKNPQVCARLVSAFNNWKKYQPELSGRMQQVLLDLDRISGLSADVKEIVSKALK
jgi:aminopeptidase N